MCSAIGAPSSPNITTVFQMARAFSASVILGLMNDFFQASMLDTSGTRLDVTETWLTMPTSGVSALHAGSVNMKQATIPRIRIFPLLG